MLCWQDLDRNMVKNIESHYNYYSFFYCTISSILSFIQLEIGFRELDGRILILKVKAGKGHCRPAMGNPSLSLLKLEVEYNLHKFDWQTM